MSADRPISDDELDALDESLSPGPVEPQVRFAQLEAALGSQEARLSGMLRISANLGQSRDPKKAMRAMVVEISQLLRADRTTIYELNTTSGMLVGLAVEGETSLEVGVPVGTGIAGLVAERGRVINLKDAYLHPAFDAKFDKLTGYRTRSMLVVPMRNSRREVIGVVQVLNKQDGYFSVDDQQLLTALAAQAAITLEALRLQLALNLSNTELSETSRQLQQKLGELELLFQVEQAIGGAADVATLADKSLQLISRVARCEAAALYLPVAETGAGPAWVRGPGSALAVHIERVEVGDGLLGKVASRGEAMVLAEEAFEAQAIPRALGGGHPMVVEDAVAVPLHDGEVTVGALALVNRHEAARRTEADDLQLAVLLAAQLARAVTRILEREDAQRRDRMETIGQMMSGVLHDLRGPMSVISGYSQLMADENGSAERAEMAAAIRRKIEMFNDMTREVMAFARGERHVLCRKVFLDKFIRSVRESVEEEFTTRGVTFRVEDRTARGLSWFDEIKMLRVVTNIARNARQAMGTQGQFEWFLDDQPGGGTRFTMRDNGPGIPEAIRGKLFDAFTTSGKQDGTGLGLAIVRRIVEDHGGTIGFTTESGQGTEFTLVLPPPPPEQVF